MLWSPSGPSVEAGTSATRFVPTASANLGGVARIVNVSAGPETFTLGDDSVTDTDAIQLAIGQQLFVAYGSDVTHIVASAATGIHVTPGIARP